jgi:alkylated DNA repair dioxygenase AlkB
MKNLLPYDGELYYCAGFVDERLVQKWFSGLLGGLKWEQEVLKMFGKEILAPRLVAWHGTAEQCYTYSGIKHVAAPMTEDMLEIAHRIREGFGIEFNTVLLNYYRDGRDGMSWHSDDERELGPAPVIACLSLGGARVIRFRHKRTRMGLGLVLEPGSLLLMSGKIQANWQHSIPKSKRVLGSRISLTFRQMG